MHTRKAARTTRGLRAAPIIAAFGIGMAAQARAQAPAPAVPVVEAPVAAQPAPVLVHVLMQTSLAQL